MKILRYILIALLILTPSVTFAVTTVGWNASSTDAGFIQPNTVNGNFDTVRSPYYVGTTTATSTFAGGLNLSSGCIAILNTCITNGGGSGTPGGSNTDVQFNNSGSFGGSSQFTWTGNTLNVTSNSGGSAAAFTYNGVSGNHAASFTSSATSSSVTITGAEQQQGTLKIKHVGTTTDSIAAALSVDAGTSTNPLGPNTQAKVLFLNSTGSTTNPIIQAQNNSNEKFDFDQNGNLDLGPSLISNNKLIVEGAASIGETVIAPTNGLLVAGNVGISNNTPGHTLAVGSFFSVDAAGEVNQGYYPFETFQDNFGSLDTLTANPGFYAPRNIQVWYAPADNAANDQGDQEAGLALDLPVNGGGFTGGEYTDTEGIEIGNQRYTVSATNPQGNATNAYINIFSQGNGTTSPLIMSFENKNGGNYSQEIQPILTADPLGILALGQFATTSSMSPYRYATGTSAAQVQILASTTMFALSVSATTSPRTPVFQVTSLGTASSTNLVASSQASAAGSFAAFNTIGQLIATTTPSGGAVSSVSNIDGTLTVSPTTGSVVASLNLNASNTWTGIPTFSQGFVNNATSTGSFGFNIAGGCYAIGNICLTQNTGTVTSIIASSPLTGGTITTTGSIGCQVASGSQAGCLASADWTTFNNKGSGTLTSLTAGTGITFSSGATCTSTCTITASGGGSNFFTNNGNSTFLSTGTNLGIGTSTPWGLLSVAASTVNLNTPMFTIGSSTNAGSTATSTPFMINGKGDAFFGTSTTVGENSVSIQNTNNTTDPFRIYNNVGTPIMTVDNVADLAMGGSGGISAGGSIQGNNFTPVFSGTAMEAGSNGNFSFGTAGVRLSTAGVNSNALLINSITAANGIRVGIGTTTPWGILSISTTTAATNSAPLFIIATSSAAGTSTSTPFIVDKNGNIGFGTTSPFITLAVNGGIAGNRFINLSGNPTVAGGTGDGSVTPSLNTSATDNGGVVSVTTGVTPSVGTIFTLTFTKSITSSCTFSPANATTAALSSSAVTSIYITNNGTNFTLNTARSSPLTGVTAYSWSYTCHE